uniref:(northern house mosquito) hypothetical protein n=1 Tax=Culex pipiens TaxID=7175 RepID=A0A8D8L7B0_CULPI
MAQGAAEQGPAGERAHVHLQAPHHLRGQRGAAGGCRAERHCRGGQTAPEGRHAGRDQHGRPNGAAPVLHRRQRRNAEPAARLRRQRQRPGQRTVDPAPRGRHLRPPQPGQDPDRARREPPLGERRRQHAVRHLRRRGSPGLHRGRDEQTGRHAGTD